MINNLIRKLIAIRCFSFKGELPLNTDQELWKSDDMMNLFFNYDYIPEDSNSNIATATLRLYRIPENNTQLNAKKLQDCVDSPSFSGEEDKLIRVSVYWYTKSLKKRRSGGSEYKIKITTENSFLPSYTLITCLVNWFD